MSRQQPDTLNLSERLPGIVYSWAAGMKMRARPVPIELSALAMRALRQSRDQRLLSSHAASCDFDSAPTLVASTLPPLNSINVGMPRMP